MSIMDASQSGTRTQIVTATRKLIEDRGIAHITTKQIAKAAGCAEGTIFRHFARKEDLLLAAVMASFPSLRESPFHWRKCNPVSFMLPKSKGLRPIFNSCH